MTFAKCRQAPRCCGYGFINGRLLTRQTLTQGVRSLIKSLIRRVSQSGIDCLDQDLLLLRL